MDSSLHLVPVRCKAAHCSCGVLEEGWEKAENKFTATSGVCVCVCVLCRLHICTCVFQCVMCAIKNLTKVLINIRIDVTYSMLYDCSPSMDAKPPWIFVSVSSRAERLIAFAI